MALVIVALAENARIPVDNPATHLELTMVHEAMVLEYSGRHLALIEAASHLKLVLYISLLICLFAPFGMAPASAGVTGWLIGLAAWTAKLLSGAALLGVWEVSIAKMRVFRLPDFVGIAFVFGFLAILLAFLTRGVLRVNQAYEISHLLAGVDAGDELRAALPGAHRRRAQRLRRAVDHAGARRRLGRPGRTTGRTCSSPPLIAFTPQGHRHSRWPCAAR